MKTRLIPLLIIVLSGACRLPKGAIESDAEKMVREQIAAEGVRDERVLAAMARIPRHEYIPAELRDRAYHDGPVSIGHGQTISQPYIVAYMTEALTVSPGMKVLEIGTGSGYQTAVLAEIGADVYTVELVPELCQRAAALLQKMDYTKVHKRCGDGYQGWKEAAPFDRVILTAAPEKIPEALLHQLKDGGILVAPVGIAVQKLVRMTKKGGKLAEESLLSVRFVPMVGATSKSESPPTVR
jgi:protein-L-isoaspartate(D-aspartate) O-methyltransferase